MDDTTQKLLPAGDAPTELPRPRAEFVAEGQLEIIMNNGCPMFWLNDAHLSELVAHHFGALRDVNSGRRLIGRVQVVISRLSE
jgi:hypothetical protein